MSTETVVLRAFPYEFEALLAQHDLEMAEIPSSVLRDTWSPVARPEFRLTVRRADMERAWACLAEAECARQVRAGDGQA
ncbi:MAG TPA: hypothetical protein VJ802_13195 [Gemmatimonadaceae bacterium]|nr:hypothetical protein [Gemmatimonadaceae bacterium]